MKVATLLLLESTGRLERKMAGGWLGLMLSVTFSALTLMVE